ncbi:hypothetical protein HBI56_163940 [Parastagonospora nodorum]|uniref:Uncharacterized protein n=1 Tax=Phaeosphaeria nodorum (strain SN15 / ATCC MYA-4574 / FGSC 10173) TaxID=321614 RepID=A0A7U2NQB3_PHANO|nr:hypothetical protein HBH56_071720 [Parastagonospora nodorum]QRD06570.1 hypothetical protein JI435_423440 [Parastagonospora nodorum SN15]KAH3927231.1 hypothetical protein HBH54_151950 [Parastagonospora nodorum]KAH3981633.1 hypothetical protein HBH51_038700 [Parastagonospora nodorum]KAH3994869.1 hypothetical protein HBI10_178600 [Parastagonospora nodorum]
MHSVLFTCRKATDEQHSYMSTLLTRSTLPCRRTTLITRAWSSSKYLQARDRLSEILRHWPSLQSH